MSMGPWNGQPGSPGSWGPPPGRRRPGYTPNLLPGSTAARVYCVVSLPVAVAMIVFGWSLFSGLSGGVTVFLVVWTGVIVFATVTNFRTLYLGVGRQADVMRQRHGRRRPPGW